jgi:Ca2+-transporting ATPase
LGFDYKKFRNREKVQKIFPFSSSKKKMATVYQDDHGSKFVFVKGAPDFLIPYCTKFINAEGTQSKMTNDYNDSLIDMI